MTGEQYIWRTVKDSDVRPAHAAREGQTFSWTNPPEGGHPGEDYNCRCWAEPVAEIEREELPPLEREEPKIPGTDIPDKGIPEQGYPGSPRFNPHKPPPSANPDPHFDKKPPQSPFMPNPGGVPKRYNEDI